MRRKEKPPKALKASRSSAVGGPEVTDSKTWSWTDPWPIKASGVEVATVKTVRVTLVPSNPTGDTDLLIVNVHITSSGYYTGADSPTTLTLRFTDASASKILDKAVRLSVECSDKERIYTRTTTVDRGALDLAEGILPGASGGMWYACSS